MSLDRTRFIDKYLEELKDLSSLLEKETILFKKDTFNTERLSSILRALHTLKGSSRMLGFSTVEKISHSLETVWKGIKESKYSFSNGIMQLVFIASDYFKELIFIIRNTHSDVHEDLPLFVDVCEKIYSSEPYDLNILKKQKNNFDLVSKEKENKEELDTSIRIESEQIDDIIKYVNVLLIKQLQIRKDFDVLNQIEESITEALLDHHSESKILLERNQITELLKKVKSFNSNFMDFSSELETSTYDIQEKVINLRMLPLNLVLDSFPRMIEEISVSLFRQVDVEMIGSNIRIDKMILEKLKSPLIHIVRNSIDHGIETPEVRQGKGKTSFGKINIQCLSDGGHVTIIVSDDGRGIDYDSVRNRALELNLCTTEELQKMEVSQLNQFLFLSGFTTKHSVTELSGRGVGLDIVKRNIEEIKGKISITSQVDKGTTFIISLPSSLSTVDGFFILSSGKKFLVPSHFVKETILINDSDKIKMVNKTMYKYRGELIPIYDLSSILDIPYNNSSRISYLLILDNMGELLGMSVDSTLSYNTLVSKPLPKDIQKLKALQGVVFDENYNMIPILYIPAVINKFKRMKSIDTKNRFIQSKKVEKIILVVDDSLNTREIEKSMLESENYTVITALDGIDGLEKIRSKKVDLVVTDINMPRMDGFTFVENMRKEEQYRDTPVIMVSSMQDDETWEKAKKVGVTEYIVKSKFDQNDLISMVKKLIGRVGEI